jgi:predicted nucleic acid-binding Zn ribbon protein
VQAFSDDPLATDPETGVPVERVLHPPAVHFKGKGFYNTDYGTRRRNRETAAAAEGSSSDKDSAGDAASAGAAGSTAGEPASADKGAAKSGDAGGSDKGAAAKAAKKGAPAKRSKAARSR